MADLFTTAQAKIIKEGATNIVHELTQDGQLNAVLKGNLPEPNSSLGMDKVVQAQIGSTQQLLMDIVLQQDNPTDYTHFIKSVKSTLGLNKAYEHLHQLGDPEYDVIGNRAKPDHETISTSILKQTGEDLETIAQSPNIAKIVEEIKAAKTTDIKHPEPTTPYLTPDQAKRLHTLYMKAKTLSDEVKGALVDRDNKEDIINQDYPYQNTKYSGGDYVGALVEAQKELRWAANELHDMLYDSGPGIDEFSGYIKDLQDHVISGTDSINGQSPKDKRALMGMSILADINDTLADVFLEEFIKQEVIANRTGKKHKNTYKIRSLEDEKEENSHHQPQEENKPLSGIQAIKNTARECIKKLDEYGVELDVDIRSKLESVINAPEGDYQEFATRIRELNQRALSSRIDAHEKASQSDHTQDRSALNTYYAICNMHRDITKQLVEGGAGKRVESEMSQQTSRY